MHFAASHSCDPSVTDGAVTALLCAYILKCELLSLPSNDPTATVSKITVGLSWLETRQFESMACGATCTTVSVST